MKRSYAAFCLACIQVILLCFLIAAESLTVAQQAKRNIVRQPSVVLGVLEDVPGVYAGDSDFRAIRAVFKKDDDQWHAFPPQTKVYPEPLTTPTAYPKAMTWTIAFDGKNLGQITSQTPTVYKFYSSIGLETITSLGV